ncbi:MAG: thioredoxin domain-containing protein [Phycisphaerae bacterium]|nr:MAG: thioredoxin domain-containing protein [Phycisphaerae bacterium]
MPNRLAHETSPYLLQHAENPVDWWPWGEAAFAEARRRDVPIFLSIGYSTCYWCHVMERESFEDAGLASRLNEHFVPVKVDREERPDLDEVYMAATLVTRGHGGWPMSVFLDPASLKPFYCGTYFPPEPRHGLADFGSVLRAMAKAWAEQRDGVLAQAGEVARAVEEHLAAGGGGELGERQVADALSHLLRTTDQTHGGFGPAPKFPQPESLRFLLDVRARAADDATGDAVDMAMRTTIDAIVLGGVRDHLGGGFHRYAVDATWTVPHFEKMLYDSAGLVAVLAVAAGRYDRPEYARAAHEAVQYVGTRLTGPHGAFLSAEDAETDGREGATYLWTPEEFRAALCPTEVEREPALADAARDATAFATAVYGLDGPPNFRDPHHPDHGARWVVRLAEMPARTAARLNLGPIEFTEKLERVRAALLEARNLRPQPRLDDKVIAAWNGMMITALCVAARELEAPAYRVMAERAADFVLRTMRDDHGGLLRVHRAGVSHIPGVLEDYAAMIQGLAELARDEPEPARGRRLAQALDLLAHARAAFFDEATGMIYDTRAGQADLFVRTCVLHDGAVACGFSTMVNALIDLAELTGDASYTQRAAWALESVAGRITASPAGSIGSMRALLRLLTAAGPNGDAPSSAAALYETKPTDRQRRLPADHAVVQVFSGVDHVELREDAPAEVSILVRIADGWHVPAAMPGDSPAAARLSPFRIDVAGGTGVRVFADYPEGEARGEGETRVRVYQGEVPIRVALEREGGWRGKPRLVMRYQACSESACQAPVTAELDIRLLGS